MKINALATSIVILVVVILLGYGVFMTFGSKAEVDAQVAILTPPDEKDPINTNILGHDTLKTVETFKSYGSHPIIVDSKNLNRPNPFDGI